MLRNFDKLPDFTAPVTGKTTICELDPNLRYHAIGLTVDDTDDTDAQLWIKQLRIKLNGRVQRSLSGAEVALLASVNSSAHNYEDGGDVKQLMVYMGEPWRRNSGEEDVLAWAVFGANNFTIEIDVLEGLTAPTISGFAITDRSKDVLEGKKDSKGVLIPQQVVIQTSEQIAVTSTGITQWKLSEVSGQLMRIHAVSSDISKIEIKAKGLVLYSLTKAESDMILEAHGLNPVAGRFDVILDYTQRVGDYLPLADNNGRPIPNLVVEFTMTSATTFDVVSQVLNTWQ